MKSFQTLTVALVMALSSVAAQAQTLDRIRSTGQIVLGYRVDAPPLSFQSPEGKADGYTPLLCVQIAQKLIPLLELESLDVEFVGVDPEEQFDKVAAGEIDLLCGVTSITAVRRQVVDFSLPVYVDGASYLTAAGGPTDFEGLADKRVGVRRDTTTEIALANALEARGAQVKLTRFADHVSGVEALENREIEAYVADQSILVGLWMTSPQQNALAMANDIFTLEKQGLALARGDSDFRLMVDQVLSSLYADGTVARALEAKIPGLTPGAGLKAMMLLAPLQD